jgi:hypothetical protein
MLAIVRPRAVETSVCVLMVLLFACSGGGESASTTTTATTAAPTTTVVASTTTVAPDELAVQVFFLDEDAFNVGRAPYVVPVERAVSASEPERGALEELFEGPTAEEQAAGLRFVASGATGIDDLRIEDGTAHVRLAGGCSSGGSTFTIADQINATLRQFERVLAVKIYDPQGETGSPDEPGDSIPFCLEP